MEPVAFSRRSVLAACCMTAVGSRSQPAAPIPESTVKAAYLLKFTAYVEWPVGTFQRRDEPMVIGVSQDDAVAADLAKLASGRLVDGHPVVTLSLGDTGHPKSLHLLYLGARPSHRLREAVAAVPGPVLVVTGQEEGLQLGSVINFFVQNGRVRFSASVASAEARALKLSARLLSVAQAEGGPAR